MAIDYIEIRHHLMIVEGSADEQPRISEIKTEVAKRGFRLVDVSIGYDDMQKMWRFNGNIKNT